MKKYGLQLRVPPDQQKKMALKPPIHPPPSIFGDDDDEDDVAKEISRQASKSRALQMIDEQQKKALDEDPLAFDYDGVYDKMKMDAARSRIQDQSKREPKYITSIIENAKKREMEHEIIYERKLLKERSKDDHEYEDKEKFVTGAYKKQLAERSKWLDQERLQELREERDDVTKKGDLSDFYFSLHKNIAFGGRTAQSVEQSRNIAGKTEGNMAIDEQALRASSQPSSSHPDFVVPRDGAKGTATTASNVDEKLIPSKQNNIKEYAEEVFAGKEDDQHKDSVTDGEQFKRGDDAITAARERFLARKKMRNQL